MRSYTLYSILLIPLFNLVKCQCPTPCGFFDQLCCTIGEICVTNSNNQAQCTTSSTSSCQPGTWAIWTDVRIATIVETKSTIYASYITTTDCSPSPPIRPTTTSCSCTSSTAKVCATGWQSCEASLGGGCCPTGYVCGPTFCTAPGIPPIRPTSTTTTSTGMICSSGYKLCPITLGDWCCPSLMSCGSTACEASPIRPTAATVIETKSIVASSSDKSIVMQSN